MMLTCLKIMSFPLKRDKKHWIKSLETELGHIKIERNIFNDMNIRIFCRYANCPNKK